MSCSIKKEHKLKPQIIKVNYQPVPKLKVKCRRVVDKSQVLKSVAKS